MSVSHSHSNAGLQSTIPLDPSGTWEEVAQSQAYSYHAFIYAWLTRRTDITIHVDLGPLQGKRTLQQLSELDPDAVNALRNEYTDTLVSLLKSKADDASAVPMYALFYDLQACLHEYAHTSMSLAHVPFGLYLWRRWQLLSDKTCNEANSAGKPSCLSHEQCLQRQVVAAV